MKNKTLLQFILQHVVAAAESYAVFLKSEPFKRAGCLSGRNGLTVKT